MIRYAVEITPQAEQEIADAVLWYASKNKVVAETFRAIVFDSIELISNSPLSWAAVSARGVRRFVLPRYPYTVFFHVIGSTVKIIAVTHHHRKPKIW